MSPETATRRAVSMPDEMPVTDQVPPQPDPQPQPQPEPTPEPAQPAPGSPPGEPPVLSGVEEEVEQDPAAEIWEGGPTYAMLHAWKEQYGPDSIYVTSITEKQHVVWRTLTRFEYRRLVKNMEQAVATGTMSQAEANMNNEEQIVEICALWPKYSRQQLAGQLAGLPSIISQEVMEASAFMSLDVKQL